MGLKQSLTFLFILIISGIGMAQSWQNVRTIEDVCKVYPERMEYIFENLNLDYPGLESTKIAYANNELEEACALLLQHYKSNADSRFVNKPQPEILHFSDAGIDSILNDIYVFQLVAGKVPRLDDGHLKWDYNGPEDDIEWAWALNRHYPVSYILPRYFQTKNIDYAMYVDSFIKDWIIQSWPYPAQKSNTAMWRGLEVSFRVKVWSQVFYGLMNNDHLSPATQLLILSSLPDHAHYAREFHAQNNWLTMELSGLAKVAVSWPEFKQSEEWLDYAVETMSESLIEQVYHEGSQTELTSSYHFVALRNFELFSEICESAGKELPVYFNAILENMYNYLAYTIRPDGFGVLNNDADRNNNVEKLYSASNKYNRNDWRFIVSNERMGEKPRTGPSIVFPWAGHFISRNNFSKDAHWSFFDIGPWGSGHQHNDKLHLSVSAFGRDLLVDAGRFAYRGEVAEKFREYAQGTQGHNCILVDGNGQMPDVKVVDIPLPRKHFKITPEFDFAWNSFDKFYNVDGEIKHTRTLCYVRDNFWIVVDRIKTDRPRKIEVLWHWHPDCELEIGEDKTTSTINDRGNLKILPYNDVNWQVKNVKGVEEPEIQGWYSEEYNKYKPNVTTIYTTEIQKDAVFFWTLVPSEYKAEGYAVKPIAIDAEGCVLDVTNSNEDNWELIIPFSESKETEFELMQK